MNGDRSDRSRRSANTPKMARGGDRARHRVVLHSVSKNWNGATPEWFILIARIEHGRDGISRVA
jgi:plasmid stabilization system protein ParE